MKLKLASDTKIKITEKSCMDWNGLRQVKA